MVHISDNVVISIKSRSGCWRHCWLIGLVWLVRLVGLVGLVWFVGFVVWFVWFFVGFVWFLIGFVGLFIGLAWPAWLFARLIWLLARLLFVKGIELKADTAWTTTHSSQGGCTFHIPGIDEHDMIFSKDKYNMSSYCAKGS